MESQSPLKPFLDLIRNISLASRMKHSRHYADFLSDRIVQASTEPGLFVMFERLISLMDADLGQMNSETIRSALVSAQDDAVGRSVLAWIREYPRVIGMLATLKYPDYEECVRHLPFDPARQIHNSGTAVPDAGHGIGIRIRCLSPLAHGSDVKAGNATLFRRMQVLTVAGEVLTLPYYSGNAFRGQMRDLLADDFIGLIGLNPRRDRPEVNLWFFHALYAGGSLCEASAADRAIRARLGGNGSVRAQAIYEFRNTLPHLSLLGCALGNRILPGRFKISDFRPVCREWGHDTAVEAASLFEWTFLTRREDHEEHDENSSMIANAECLKPGTVLSGGIDVDMHAMPMERSALARGLNLMMRHGYIGADNRRGFGKVDIDVEGLEDEAPYLDYMVAEREKIRDYLMETGAIGHDSSD